MGEMVDVVNELDEVIGSAPRKNIHDTNHFHRAVHLFIFNDDGKLWLEKRAPHCDTFPGYYSSSVAGHVGRGETYDQAARRELKEELGLGGVKLKRLHKLRASAETSNEFVAFFVGKSNEKPRLHSDSAKLIALSLEEISDQIQAGERMVPNFLALFSWYVSNLLFCGAGNGMPPAP